MPKVTAKEIDFLLDKIDPLKAIESQRLRLYLVLHSAVENENPTVQKRIKRIRDILKGPKDITDEVSEPEGKVEVLSMLLDMLNVQASLFKKHFPQRLRKGKGALLTDNQIASKLIDLNSQGFTFEELLQALFKNYPSVARLEKQRILKILNAVLEAVGRDANVTIEMVEALLDKAHHG